MNAIYKCEFCQSFPDCYICSNPNAFVVNKSGTKLGPRECFFVHMDEWGELWLAHPCPFFKGTINLVEENIRLAIEKPNNTITVLEVNKK